MTSQTRYIFLLRYILPIVDLLVINVTYFTAYEITKHIGKIGWLEANVNRLIVCNLIWLVCSAFFGLYNIFLGDRKMERVYSATWKSAVLHFVLFIIYLAFHKENDFSRSFVIIFYLLLIVAFVINRFLGTSFHYMLLTKLKTVRKIAIIGSNNLSVRVLAYFEEENNVAFYGSLGGDESVYFKRNTDIADNVAKKITTAAQAGVKDIYVTVAPERMTEVQPLLEEADKQGVRLKFIPDLGLNFSPNYAISYLGGEFPLITLRHEPLEEIGNRFKKRAFDVIFSSLVIVFVLSWLYPIIAILIKLQSPGPVLFKQLRSGRKDEPFWCYKFRSMRINNDSHKKQATKGDDRITPIGQFLRKTSLDEMPQFFNVFMGQMSVVGPRPHMLAHTTMYKEIIDQFMVRHFVKPGITGWAQVNGYRGETKRNQDMENRVKYDIWYLENWTGMLDVRIVFLTILNVAKGEENAY